MGHHRLHAGGRFRSAPALLSTTIRIASLSPFSSTTTPAILGSGPTTPASRKRVRSESVAQAGGLPVTFCTF
jgi:hypothetical protein